ncbi:ATP-binding protein [Streptomyces humi]
MRRFVGRRAELEQFREMLDRPPDDVRVLALHGPGGIGKTVLLRRLALEAVQLGRHVVEVTAERVGTAEALAAAAGPAGEPLVLFVDTVEHPGPLDEDWFRERFLTSLAPGSLVVLAGRQPPGLRWRTDPAWQDSLLVRRLGVLAHEEAVRMLAGTAAPAVGRRARIAFADGHPLALRLVGEDSGHGPGERWQPSPLVVGALLRQVVDAPPSAEHRRGLEICAHVPDTTEDMLRVLIPERAYEVFDWLRCRPYVMTRRDGLCLLPVVAEAVERDLRWRAPDSYLSMHKAVRAHLQELVRHRPEPESLRAAAAFNRVQARGGRMVGLGWDDCDESVHETPCDAEGIRSVRELASGRLDADGLTVLDFWLHRRPGSFRLYRSAATGQVVGCLALLRFGRWDAAETGIDPVVAAVRDHVEGEAGPRAGQFADLVRFMFVRQRCPERPVVLSRMLARLTREVLSQDRLGWTFLAVDGDPRLSRLLESADFRRLPAQPLSAGRRLSLFAHDWRGVGVSEWADLLDDRMFGGSPVAVGASAARTTVISRAAFDAAVLDALRAWHQPERLADNPLLQAAFVVRRAGEPEQLLRDLIVRAVEAIGEGPRVAWQRAAVRATYLVGGRPQQAVARELSVSFSTYRRHLKRGVERVCWYLWEQEMTHVALSRGPSGGDSGVKAPG